MHCGKLRAFPLAKEGWFGAEDGARVGHVRGGNSGGKGRDYSHHVSRRAEGRARARRDGRRGGEARRPLGRPPRAAPEERRLVPLPVMLPRFWVVSTKPEAALACSKAGLPW